MTSRDQFKRIISFFSAVVMMGLLCANFAFTWNSEYKDIIMFPFYRRGNWVLIIINAVITFLFSKVYGALKIGYLKKTDTFYSESIAVVCTNAVMYMLISLIARHLIPPLPMIWLTITDFAFLFLWIFASNALFF